MTETIKLFERREDCCGCGACANRCPRDAIELRLDEFGCRYPVIRAERCVGCGLCKDACHFQKRNTAPLPDTAYAAQAVYEGLLNGSASGGMFAALARVVLEAGGAVAGCALERDGGGLLPRHILIRDLSELPKLQGSKYVQSIPGDIYRRVRGELEAGRQVLFSGTPCQVDGLKGYLGRPYPGLLTVDLVCHGVPGDGFFADYIRALETRRRAAVTDFRFRDKSGGWGLHGSVTFRAKNGREKRKRFPAGSCSYYHLFLTGESYRDSCYRCPYACMRRPGDLTLGDFWGIDSRHPEYLKENGGSLDAEKGISCLLVNTAKGRAALDMLSAAVELRPSRPEAVAHANGQLNHPAVPGKNREKILSLYRGYGYPAVEVWFLLHRIIRKLRPRRKAEREEAGPR